MFAATVYSTESYVIVFDRALRWLGVREGGMAGADVPSHPKGESGKLQADQVQY